MADDNNAVAQINNLKDDTGRPVRWNSNDGYIIDAPIYDKKQAEDVAKTTMMGGRGNGQYAHVIEDKEKGGYFIAINAPDKMNAGMTAQLTSALDKTLVGQDEANKGRDAKVADIQEQFPEARRNGLRVEIPVANRSDAEKVAGYLGNSKEVQARNGQKYQQLVETKIEERGGQSVVVLENIDKIDANKAEKGSAAAMAAIKNGADKSEGAMAFVERKTHLDIQRDKDGVTYFVEFKGVDDQAKGDLLKKTADGLNKIAAGSARIANGRVEIDESRMQQLGNVQNEAFNALRPVESSYALAQSNFAAKQAETLAAKENQMQSEYAAAQLAAAQPAAPAQSTAQRAQSAPAQATPETQTATLTRREAPAQRAPEQPTEHEVRGGLVSDLKKPTSPQEGQSAAEQKPSPVKPAAPSAAVADKGNPAQPKETARGSDAASRDTRANPTKGAEPAVAARGDGVDPFTDNKTSPSASKLTAAQQEVRDSLVAYKQSGDLGDATRYREAVGKLLDEAKIDKDGNHTFSKDEQKAFKGQMETALAGTGISFDDARKARDTMLAQSTEILAKGGTALEQGTRDKLAGNLDVNYDKKTSDKEIGRGVEQYASVEKERGLKDLGGDALDKVKAQVAAAIQGTKSQLADMGSTVQQASNLARENGAPPVPGKGPSTQQVASK